MNLLAHPRAEETLCLLKATFLEGEEALKAWQQWCRIGCFDDLPAGTYALFPRLYNSLNRLNISHPFRQRMRGVQRKVWYQNQLNVRRFETVVHLAQEHPDPLVLIYGLYMHSDDYRNEYTGLLPVRQLRLWCGNGLIAYLARQVPKQIPSLVQTRQPATMRSWELADRTGFKLQFYPVPPVVYLARQPAQADIVRAQFGDAVVGMLSLPLQTLWSALEVTRGRTTFPAEALAQTLTLMEQVLATERWEELIDTARRYRRMPHLRAVLQFMRQQLSNSVVPDSAWESVAHHADGLAATWHFTNWHRLPPERALLYRVQNRLRRAITKGV